MDNLRFAAMGYPITHTLITVSTRESEKQTRAQPRTREPEKAPETEDANFAMERTPNVNVRWWTTILPMLKFPRYYTRGNMMEPPSPLSIRATIRCPKECRSSYQKTFSRGKSLR